MNNCAGGTTPWGTVLSGEENFNQYFKADRHRPQGGALRLSSTQDTRNWRSVDPRWDATSPAYANEPNRFGWIVEIDPFDPKSTPVKHTAHGPVQARGRERHRQRATATSWPTWVTTSGSTTSTSSCRARRSARAGRASDRAPQQDAAQRGRPLRRPVHRRRPRGRRQRRDRRVDPADQGRQSHGAGVQRSRRCSSTPGWRPTPCSRPRWTVPRTSSRASVNGRIYVACTNNTDRGKPGKAGADRAEPAGRPTRTGTSSRSSPSDGDHTADDVLVEPAAHLRRPGHGRHLLRRLHRARSRRSRAPTTSPSTAWATSGSPPTASRPHWRTATRLLQGPGRRARARSRPAVPRGARRRRDLRPGDPRPGRIGVRRRPAPGRGRHLGDAPQSRFPDFVSPLGTPKKGEFAGLGRPSSR